MDRWRQTFRRVQPVRWFLWLGDRVLKGLRDAVTCGHESQLLAMVVTWEHLFASASRRMLGARTLLTDEVDANLSDKPEADD